MKGKLTIKNFDGRIQGSKEFDLPSELLNMVEYAFKTFSPWNIRITEPKEYVRFIDDAIRLKYGYLYEKVDRENIE